MPNPEKKKGGEKKIKEEERREEDRKGKREEKQSRHAARTHSKPLRIPMAGADVCNVRVPAAARTAAAAPDLIAANMISICAKGEEATGTAPLTQPTQNLLPRGLHPPPRRSTKSILYGASCRH